MKMFTRNDKYSFLLAFGGPSKNVAELLYIAEH